MRNVGIGFLLFIGLGAVVLFWKFYIIPNLDSSESREFVPRKNLTFGVMFIVYGDRYEKYLNEVEKGVMFFKRMNPSVPVAVFSPEQHLNFTVEYQGITEGHGPREWYTRISRLWDSPFDVTFSIDSQSISCAPLQVDTILEQARKHDMMLRPKWCDARRKKANFIEPAGGAIIFRKTKRMKHLIATWKKIHKGVGGHKRDVDDQTTLYEALVRHENRIRVAYMPPHWFTFVQKSEKNGSPKERRSAIIREMPWLFHLNNIDVCSQFNAVKGSDPIGYQIVQITPYKYELSAVSEPHTCLTNIACCSNESNNIVLIGNEDVKS